MMTQTPPGGKGQPATYQQGAAEYAYCLRWARQLRRQGDRKAAARWLQLAADERRLFSTEKP